jgi:hypothetical protein
VVSSIHIVAGTARGDYLRRGPCIFTLRKRAWKSGRRQKESGGKENGVSENFEDFSLCGFVKCPSLEIVT